MPETVPNSNSNNLSKYSLWGVLSAAFIAAYYPVWKNLVTTWWNNESYSHGFAIVPLSLFILWRKRDELRETAGEGTDSGLLVAGAALFTYIFALAGEIRTLASLSMLIFLGGAISYLWGYRLLRLTLFPLGLLAFMIPIPAQLLAALTIPLQLLVTDIAGLFAKMIGIPILVQGNLIQLPGRTFEVVEACSGLRSIMALVTLGAVMGYFTLNKTWSRILLIAGAFPIAIVANSARLLAMVIFFFYFKIDLLQEGAHTLFGMGVFIITICMFFGVQKVLSKCQGRK